MKINYEYDMNETYFELLDDGELFTCDDEKSCVFMKIEEDDEVDFNAVNLTRACFSEFTLCKKVYRLEGVLNIKKT